MATAMTLIEKLVVDEFDRLRKNRDEMAAFEELANAVPSLANTAAALKAIAADVEREATPEALRRRAVKATTSTELLQRSVLTVGGIGPVKTGGGEHLARLGRAVDKLAGFRRQEEEFRRRAAAMPHGAERLELLSKADAAAASAKNLEDDPASLVEKGG